MTRLYAPFAVRAATPDDVSRIAAIELSAFSDPWPESAFNDLLLLSHARTVVAADSRCTVVGYCIVVGAADEGEIANIAVAPSAQRRGIGALLLDDAIASSARIGFRRLFLEVRTSNEPAIALYLSRGFFTVGRRRAYYREPLEDALVLRWDAEPVV